MLPTLPDAAELAKTLEPITPKSGFMVKRVGIGSTTSNIDASTALESPYLTKSIAKINGGNFKKH